MNKIELIGNLTADPESKETPNGINSSAFSLAVKGRQKDQNGKLITDFFNCYAYKNCADIINKNCHKGDKIAIIGSMQSRKYEAEDGRIIVYWSVLVDEVELITTQTKITGVTKNTPKAKPTLMEEPINEEHLPF